MTNLILLLSQALKSKKDITKVSRSVRSKLLKRQKLAPVETLLEDQFTSGKLLGKSYFLLYLVMMITS